MLQKILQNKPYLAWYVKNRSTLSDVSTLEHILSYGNWDDILEAEKTVGISKMKSLFQEIASKKRVNLKPQTLNFFQNYFDKYA
ncbi:hypothetical protein A2962_01620 [Candidatus Woesebacteria bacterium RIFCSPLOWO2_01_FULL_39_61]|uniref:Uncharacterized protein n=1 Tax=Candidatus Woesebacteria bacterium RIFCSPHIGHO2_02_FULL_39_13 TaxID=1802505 RepID=A0A1F7Z4E4_9BACT|nr:MAG: hypothetical protein A2692_01860 [Candidatus Woesebacteria bacterium RIFCSPHIGHO2_01_FULL_39_95]OGM34543.1 MAG: hypothetical protein A3D01_03310 [Candidatus Woesebacteria bacterium RIFCSPHIGHO2_02_FULL_39_13]OGM38810.1 MAG: hypothetical protein A3E13_01205 [Candidatus Woesebacteria bacterium RIFCSPHIGHO2_12_FULL_40_20]OGM65816.1 MAG: hypothetical protein A2962_01620 [Candidatus Woesebacteria bacterium RIFCSPLOWO2_01_FULL_39_61]OGM71629.1 MAG: hypothetical protein A3H19_04920 [Candidatus